MNNPPARALARCKGRVNSKCSTDHWLCDFRFIQMAHSAFWNTRARACDDAFGPYTAYNEKEETKRRNAEGRMSMCATSDGDADTNWYIGVVAGKELLRGLQWAAPCVRKGEASSVGGPRQQQCAPECARLTLRVLARPVGRGWGDTCAVEVGLGGAELVGERAQWGFLECSGGILRVLSKAGLFTWQQPTIVQHSLCLAVLGVRG